MHSARAPTFLRIWGTTASLYWRHYWRFAAILAPFYLAHSVAFSAYDLLAGFAVAPDGGIPLKSEYSDLVSTSTPSLAGLRCLLCCVAPPLVILAALLSVVASGALVRAADNAWNGRPIGIVDAYSYALSRVGPLLGASLLYCLVVILLAVTVVGLPVAVYFAVRWAFVYQVLVVEGGGSSAALARSSDLVRGRWWPVAGIGAAFVAASVGVSLALSYGVWAGLTAALSMTGDVPMLALAVSEAPQAITGVLIGALGVIGQSVVFRDLRASRDGAAVANDPSTLAAPACS